MGSFPTAYLLVRWLEGLDIREHGSRNPGALNTYRRFGVWTGVLVLAVDAGKGALAILVGQLLEVPDGALYLAALLATLGHNFSPFLRFKGGKGAATVLGISAVMLWQITAVTVVFGVVLFALTRHAVWSIAGGFIMLNALTIGTLQPLGQIGLCLALSLVVAGTHLWRQHPQLVPAIRQRQWRRLSSIE